MRHVEPALLQAYLNGEIDPADLPQVEEHLADCSVCADQLAQLTADDTFLAQSMTVTEDERAWIASIDLPRAVVQQITPWYQHPQAIFVAVIALAAAGWLQGRVVEQLGGAVASLGAIGLTVQLLRSGVHLLWDLLLFLSNGGLLPSLLPVMLLAAGVWVLRHFKKEVKGYA